MGLIQQATPPRIADTRVIESAFTIEDVDVIIKVLAGASFPVKDIESLYRAIYKLQELRNKLKNDAS
jgi:hypothetical protein